MESGVWPGVDAKGHRAIPVQPSDKSWTVYSMRSDLRFDRYTPVAPQPGIGPLLDEVARDPHACFWG